MKRETVEVVIKDLETLASHLKELLVSEKDENSKTENNKKIELEDVRAVLAKLSQHGKTAEVKELIAKYGGTKLSDVPKKNYAQLLKDVEEIKID